MKSKYEDRPYFWKQGYIAFFDPLKANTPHCLDVHGERDFKDGFQQAEKDILSDGDKS